MSNFFLKKTLTTPPKKQTKEKTENKTKHNIKKKNPANLLLYSLDLLLALLCYNLCIHKVQWS